jgi:hypothetical protein
MELDLCPCPINIQMTFDYELGPDTTYGRAVHHRGRTVGVIYELLSSRGEGTAEYLALVRVFGARERLVAKNLGEYPTVEGAFNAIVTAHAG